MPIKVELKWQRALVQKVNAKEELNKAEQQTVLNKSLKLRDYHSLKLPLCSCVSITLPVPSKTRITAWCARL